MGRKANSRRRRRRRREEKKKEIIPEEKTQTEAEPNLPDIPEEIVVDIRSRLPLKSLSRFTCVSKQWHSAISDILAERIGGMMALVESTIRCYDWEEEELRAEPTYTAYSGNEQPNTQRIINNTQNVLESNRKSNGS
ncbi:hypothetical protein C3L33_14953, partial [Rhododendron williamsianum]